MLPLPRTSISPRSINTNPVRRDAAMFGPTRIRPTMQVDSMREATFIVTPQTSWKNFRVPATPAGRTQFRERKICHHFGMLSRMQARPAGLPARVCDGIGHAFRYQGFGVVGAGEGNRTLVCSLGSCRSTIELRPRSPLMISRPRAIRQAFRSPSRFTVNFRKFRIRALKPAL